MKWHAEENFSLMWSGIGDTRNNRHEHSGRYIGSFLIGSDLVSLSRTAAASGPRDYTFPRACAGLCLYDVCTVHLRKVPLHRVA